MKMHLVWPKIKSEAIAVFVLAVYFTIFFMAISYFRLSIARKPELLVDYFWTILLKALVCTKFMLIGKHVFPIKIKENKALIWHVLTRTFIYLLVVTIFLILEEAIVGHMNGHTLREAIVGLAPGTINLFFAMEILYGLMLFPYVAYAAASKSLGENRLNKLFFGK